MTYRAIIGQSSCRTTSTNSSVCKSDVHIVQYLSFMMVWGSLVPHTTILQNVFRGPPQKDIVFRAPIMLPIPSKCEHTQEKFGSPSCRKVSHFLWSNCFGKGYGPIRWLPLVTFAGIVFFPDKSQQKCSFNVSKALARLHYQAIFD